MQSSLQVSACNGFLPIIRAIVVIILLLAALNVNLAQRLPIGVGLDQIAISVNFNSHNNTDISEVQQEVKS